MSNIAIIGEKEIIIGFNLLGIKLFYANTPEEAIRALKECEQNHFSIVFITNEIAMTIISEIEQYQAISSMAISILPNRSEDTKISMEILKKNVEKAVGTDILFRKEES